MAEGVIESDKLRELVDAAEEALDVISVRRPAAPPATGRGRGFLNVDLEILGRLRIPSDRAYEIVAERFRALGHVALFRRSPDGVLVLALPGSLPKAAGQASVAVLLFLATLVSVVWTGALNEQRPGESLNLLAGLPFAVSLLGILLAHEMGHYLVARRLGTPATLPYFIPAPLLLGTMGAVMLMKAPPRNRRAMLAIGAAGPLAGLAVAVPVLIIGLRLSTVSVIPTNIPTLQEGNSLLYLAIKYALFGRVLPADGVDVWLHPVAWAGWAGLYVTALNLIPAGMLDGGHILYALIGERARYVTWGIIAFLLLLSFRWQGWLLWAAVVLFLGRAHAVPLDDVTDLRSRERALAIFMLIVAVVVFVPEPLIERLPW